MRRLNDITIHMDDRRGGSQPESPPRAPKGKRSSGINAPQKIRRRWVPPFWWKPAKHAGLIVLVTGSVAGLPAWAIHSGVGSKLGDSLTAQVVGLSARAGFRVDDILVEGRVRTPREELLTALNVNRGDPIFGIDLTATRQRLEEISWVKTATLERRLPGEVHILITEREPIARWQNQGHYYLVDREGLVVGDQIEDFPDLPLIVGEGAPDHAGALLEMLKTEPALQARVKAAQWVSERRWNLTLDRTAGGIDIRLPEETPDDALHELAKLDREQSLLERKVTLIDMRLPDRLILRSTGGAEESSAAAAAANQVKRKSPPGKDA